MSLWRSWICGKPGAASTCSGLLLLPSPVVLVLNMMDVAEQEGVQFRPRFGGNAGHPRHPDGGDAQ